MTKEACIKEIIERVNSCKGTTCYGDKEIDIMKKNGEKFLNMIYDLNGNKYFMAEDKKREKEIELKISGYRFSHNDFQVQTGDFKTYMALKEIFQEWRNEDMEKRKKRIIGSVGGNGYANTFVVSYEWGLEL